MHLSRAAPCISCLRDVFWAAFLSDGCAGEIFLDSGRTGAARMRPAGCVRHEQPHEHDAPDTGVLRLAGADARRDDQAMRNAPAGQASGGVGNGIVAPSRSSAATTKTVSAGGSAGATIAVSSVAAIAAFSAGAGIAAGAFADCRVGADRARCGDLPRARAGLRPDVRTRPFCQGQRLSLRQHQRTCAASAARAVPRIQIGVQSLQLQICHRE